MLGFYFEIDDGGIFLWGPELFVMQPTTGIGLTTFFFLGGTFGTREYVFGIGIMFKVDNNWAPPEQFYRK